jgi:hypothetical protein
MKSARDSIQSFLSESVTPVAIKAPSWRLSVGSRLFFSGSCFAAELYDWGFVRALHVSKDPFGPIFNPLSLSGCLGRLLSGETVRTGELFESGGLWRHPLFHTRCTDSDPGRLVDSLNSGMDESRQALVSADILCLTLGTPWVYRHRESGLVFNNCHKLPADRFDRILLSAEESAEALSDLVQKQQQVNPDVRFVVSLSPVRHLRDDPSENSLGKAILRCALEKLRGDAVWYFPAWEIMMDELRDYRWYGPDLVHPSETAVDYILSRFMGTVGNPELKSLLDGVERLLKAHRHVSGDSASREAELSKNDFNRKRRDILMAHPSLSPRFERIFPEK